MVGARAVAVVVLGLLLGVDGPPTRAGTGTGPPLTVSREDFEGAFECGELSSSAEPVLLVHGTATNAAESLSWNLGVVLPAAGYDVCTVDLPQRALIDQQESAEYVVHAVRELVARLEAAGRPGRVDVIGHSQGTLEPRWAARWWPDVRSAVDDLIQMAPPNRGTQSAAAACAGPCAPAIHQMVPGSAYLDALNGGDPVPAVVDITAVVSLTDDLVQPAPDASMLDGATVIVIQDLCPGRYVNHVELLADAVAVDLVLDALAHDGPADASRFDPARCAAGVADGLDPLTVAARTGQVYANGAGAVAAGPTTDTEPPLRSYVTAGPEDPAPGGPTGGDVAGATTPGTTTVPGRTLPATGGGIGPAVAALVALAGAVAARRVGRPARDARTG